QSWPIPRSDTLAAHILRSRGNESYAVLDENTARAGRTEFYRNPLKALRQANISRLVKAADVKEVRPALAPRSRARVATCRTAGRSTAACGRTPELASPVDEDLGLSAPRFSRAAWCGGSTETQCVHTALTYGSCLHVDTLPPCWPRLCERPGAN